MSDSGRFSDRDIERDLRDLGARIEYPPAPDLAPAVRRRLDEEAARQSPRRGFWRPLLSPRWAVPAAALVLISFALLSPAVRETLSGFFVSGQAASGGAAVSEAGESATRPESGGSAACPSLSLDAEPARGTPGAKFRLHGGGFSTGCDETRPARGVRLDFRQDGRTWRLATVDADRRLAFDAGLRIPAGSGPGQATVRATTRSGELVEERFLVLR